MRLTSSEGEVRIDVTDSGQGIEPGLLPHIFEMFAQGLEARRKTGGGMGIGLALVKQLAEMHGGRVMARSDGVGHGSMMSVILPTLEDRTPKLGGVADGEASLKGLSVLIVDDDHESGGALAALLELEGSRPLTAHGADEAMAVLEREVIGLLICDVSLRGATGYPLIERVRNDQRFAHIPTIALTDLSGSLGDPGKRIAGFDLYLSKPVSLDALMAAAGQLLRGGTEEKA